MKQRFLSVGGARFTIVEAIAHDPADAGDLPRLLDQHQPRRVLIAAPTARWQAFRKDAAHLPPLEQEQVLALMTVMRPQPNAVWVAAVQWCIQNKVQPTLLADAPEAPPKAVKALAKLLRAEGFDAASPTSAIDRFHGHYVKRIPALREWVAQARDAWADALDRAWGHDMRALVLFGAPDADPVCDRLAGRH